MEGMNMEFICKEMEQKYHCFEVRYPVSSPTETGKVLGRVPIFEQALSAAKRLRGALYGVKSNGEMVEIWY